MEGETVQKSSARVWRKSALPGPGHVEGARQGQGQFKMGQGHFIGVRSETGEILIGNDEGVEKAWDFRRIADEE